MNFFFLRYRRQLERRPIKLHGNQYIAQHIHYLES